MIDWKTICQFGYGYNLSMAVIEPLHPFFLRCDHRLLAEMSADRCQDYQEKIVQEAICDEGDRKTFRLLCIIANFQAFRDFYNRQGFPEKMFMDIVGDLKIWLSTTDSAVESSGLNARLMQWFIAILNGHVMQFGRLQCNPFHLFELKKSLYRTEKGGIDIRTWNDPANLPRPDLAYQDKTINLHIPASGRLLVEDCLQSLKEMVDFMRRFRPDVDFKAFVCYSWLLNPLFQETLKPESNIRRFQGLGHLIPMPDVDETQEIKWRLWGDEYMNSEPGDLPADNSLRRIVAKKLQAGERISSGCMVIFPDEARAMYLDMHK